MSGMLLARCLPRHHQLIGQSTSHILNSQPLAAASWQAAPSSRARRSNFSWRRIVIDRLDGAAACRWPQVLYRPMTGGSSDDGAGGGGVALNYQSDPLLAALPITASGEFLILHLSRSLARLEMSLCRRRCCRCDFGVPFVTFCDNTNRMIVVPARMSSCLRRPATASASPTVCSCIR
jgi:hypothetical protein